MRLVMSQLLRMKMNCEKRATFRLNRDGGPRRHSLTLHDEWPFSPPQKSSVSDCSVTSEILLATFGNHCRASHFGTCCIFAYISYGRRKLRRMLPRSLAVLIRQSKIAHESCLCTSRMPKENLLDFCVIHSARFEFFTQNHRVDIFCSVTSILYQTPVPISFRSRAVNSTFWKESRFNSSLSKQNESRRAAFLARRPWDPSSEDSKWRSDRATRKLTRRHWMTSGFSIDVLDIFHC
jgi:hypothetical protein